MHVKAHLHTHKRLLAVNCKYEFTPRQLVQCRFTAFAALDAHRMGTMASGGEE